MELPPEVHQRYIRLDSVSQPHASIEKKTLPGSFWENSALESLGCFSSWRNKDISVLFFFFFLHPWNHIFTLTPTGIYHLRSPLSEQRNPVAMLATSWTGSCSMRRTRLSGQKLLLRVKRGKLDCQLELLWVEWMSFWIWVLMTLFMSTDTIWKDSATWYAKKQAGRAHSRPVKVGNRFLTHRL